MEKKNMVITRTYDDYSDARNAVEAVKKLGVSSDAISVVAARDHVEGARNGDADDVSSTGTGAGVGGALGGGAGLLAGLGMMAIPGVGPIVAAGWLAATAAGAAVGAAAGAAAGGLVDAMTDSGVPERDAHLYAEAVRRGGVLVSVRVMGVDEAAVTSALDSHNPADLSIRRDAWQQEGWTSYDPNAATYTPEQRRSERARYM
jgi:hypothetical protein